MEYKLLWGNSAESLTKEVNEHLAKGWELYGNPFTSEKSRYQAMTLQNRDRMELYTPKTEA